MTNNSKYYKWAMVFIVLFTFVIYWLYFSKPTSFPNKNKLQMEINQNPLFFVKSIQDIIYLDEKHAFVPFISKDDTYGLSYWVWSMHEWKLASVDSKGEPKIWKVSKNDPSSHYIIWNIHPEDHLKTLRFFLIKDRNYRGIDGVHFYSPRVQLEKSFSLKNKSYGFMKLPKGWITFIEDFKRVEFAKQSNIFSQSFFSERNMFFGWIPYDQSGKETFPEKSVNSNRYSIKDINIDYLMILNEVDLE